MLVLEAVAELKLMLSGLGGSICHASPIQKTLRLALDDGTDPTATEIKRLMIKIINIQFAGSFYIIQTAYG